MDHIQDVYKKKPEMIEKIWDHLTKVNLKVDGKPFQVLYNDEEDELEFHGRSGNETKVGPLISDYERLFSKPINDAIAHIETRIDVFKKYKFLTFEVINEILLLTAIIKDNGEFVNSPAEIDKIAKELDTDVMPALWEGKISEEQKTTIMEVISTGIVPTKADFIKWVKDLFGSYAKFPKKLISATDEFIEGIVFFFNVDGKIVEYKLVDPSYRQSMKDRDEASKQEQEKNAKYYEEIYNFFLDWSEENAKGEDDNRIVSIQKNFLNMMSDPKVHSKLMNLGSKIKINDSKTYTIQPGRCCEEMKKAIKKHGAVYKNLFEKYIKLFYKGKKRGFVISKEFQDRVNKVVDKFADYSLDENLDIEVNYMIYSITESHFENFNFSQYHKHKNEYAIAVIDFLLNNANENGEGKIACGDKINDIKQLDFKTNLNKLKQLKTELEKNDQSNKVDVNEFNNIVKIGNKPAWSQIFKGTFSGKISNTAGQQIEGYICYLFNNDSEDDIETWKTKNNINTSFDKSWQESSNNTIKIIKDFFKENNLKQNNFYALKKDSIIDENSEFKEIYLLFNLKDNYGKIIKQRYSAPDKWNTADIILINKLEIENINKSLNELSEDSETNVENINSWLKQQIEVFNLIPISLKKVINNGNIYAINFNKGDEISDITNIKINYLCKTPTDSFKIHCNNSNYIIDFRLNTNRIKRPSIEGESKNARTGKGTSVIKSMLKIPNKNHDYYEKISKNDEKIFDLIKKEKNITLTDTLKNSDFSTLITNINFCTMIGLFKLYISDDNKDINQNKKSFFDFMKFIIECCQTPASPTYIIK